MKNIPLSAIFFTFYFLLLICSASYALEIPSVGVITRLEGIVDIAHEGEEEVTLLDKGALVYLNDRIRTKSHSKAEIKFSDKSIVRLAPGSCIYVKKYLVENNKRKQANIKLTRGKLQAVVARTGKPETFVITTPNAEGRVKGSDIFVFYNAGKTGALVQKGLMSLSSIILPHEEIDLKKGDYSMVGFKEAPIEPRGYFEAELMRHKKDVKPVIVKKWVPGDGATQMTGVITFVSGEVRLYKKGNMGWEDANVEDVVSEGYKVQTGDDGNVEIRLSNGNSIFLQVNTELAVANLKYDPKTGEYQNTFESNNGKLKAVIGRLSKASTFEVKTPTALCGVHGTVVYLNIEPSQTQAFYEGGGGTVTSTISGNTQVLQAGQNTTVDIAGAVSIPVYTPNSQRINLQQSLGGQQQVISAYQNPASQAAPHDTLTALAPAPTPAVMPGNGIGDIIDPIDDPFEPLPFDEPNPGVLPPPPPQPANIFDNTLTIDLGSSSSFFDAGSIVDLQIKDNGTWQAQICGNYDEVPPGGAWSAVFTHIDASADIYAGTGTWSSGEWSGTMDGLATTSCPDNPNKSFSGSATGTYSGGATGTFVGTGSGTWLDV